MLSRIWGPPPWALFIGFNPSKADGKRDDPTTNRWRDFCKGWGFGGYVAGNLSAYRATAPKDLAAAGYLVGEENDRCLQEAAELTDRIVVCWGSSGGEWATQRGREVNYLFPTLELWCWGLNADGNPRHPIARGKNRLSDDAPLMLWVPT